jgi:RNA polymerase sigma-70 factor (ECF subfamily)
MRDPSKQPTTIEGLTQRLGSPLRRFFTKRIARGHHEDVDDLVQEVFVRMAAEGRIDAVNGAEAYVFRTAANLLNDHRRRLASHAADAHDSYSVELHDAAAQTFSLERELLGKEALERLFAALLGLPERTRAVWVLYHFEDLAHAEIARQLGMAQSTVEKHMNRASTHLLKHFGGKP